MTPKEKAADLIYDFHEVKSNEYNYGITWEMAQRCALIAVDEIINSLYSVIHIIEDNRLDEFLKNCEFYRIVKKEIENL